MMSFRDIALPLSALGIPVTPVGANSKAAFLSDWPTSATTDVVQIEAWDRAYGNINCAAVATGKPDGIWIFEVDAAEVLTRIEAETGHSLTTEVPTYLVRSRPGRGHIYFRNTPAALAMGNISQSYVKHGDFSVRVHNMYCVAAGSIHPQSKEPYVCLTPVGVQPAPAPQWLIDWLLAQKIGSTTADKAKDIPVDAAGLIPHGSIHGWLVTQAGRLRAAGSSGANLEGALIDLAHKFCAPPINDEQVRQVANSFEKYEPNPPDMILNQKPDDPSNPQLLFIPDEDPTWEYAITREEYEAQLENEFPVLPLKLSSGPTWEDDIMYGIAGDIVRKASEFCEAHPAGMYLDVIVSFGNMIGREPYFNVSSTQHHSNEFMVRVGDTAVSRKGTGRDAVNEVLKMVDPAWYSSRVMSGFGSSEAIINEIRDDSVQSVRKRKNNTFESLLVPGVQDKRLMIREGELASIFQLAGRPESRADVVLRDGWDGHALRNLVKGKSDGLSNSNSCQFPHVSISADTTRDELIRKMPSGAESNGFGNRFLYCYVQRVKLCANGGPPINWAPELQRLHAALSFARDLQYIGMQTSARVLWSRMYSEIEKEMASMFGLAASMTARAAAHVRRLALILCLLDGQDVIEATHLRAAKRIWDYCQDSTRYIFGGLTKDQEIILSWLRSHAPVTVSEIANQLFQRHKKVDWVRLHINALIRAGKVELKGEQIVVKP